MPIETDVKAKGKKRGRKSKKKGGTKTAVKPSSDVSSADEGEKGEENKSKTNKPAKKVIPAWASLSGSGRDRAAASVARPKIGDIIMEAVKVGFDITLLTDMETGIS